MHTKVQLIFKYKLEVLISRPSFRPVTVIIKKTGCPCLGRCLQNMLQSLCFWSCGIALFWTTTVCTLCTTFNVGFKICVNETINFFRAFLLLLNMILDHNKKVSNFQFFYRERPAAIAVTVKSIDDTSNFDDFPDVDLKIPAAGSAVPPTAIGPKDWVFINYTFKRFEGLPR